MPSSPPTVYVPPSEGDPPDAPGAVYTAPSAGSPPGAPGAVFEVPSSEISDAILRVTGSLESYPEVPRVPPDLLTTGFDSWTSDGEENPPAVAGYWWKNWLGPTDTKWTLDLYTTTTGGATLTARWGNSVVNGSLNPWDESVTYPPTGDATGTPVIRRLSGPAGPPVIFVP